ncbi:MAG: type I phosphomannose isomerase catalytic subunit [Fimbriiglobus sp.]
MLGLLTFEPILKSMLWGGSRLPGYLGIGPVPQQPYGEAWVLSDVDGSESLIASGPHRGQTLRELTKTHGHELYGQQIPADGKFPLLLKFIDARQELSVQVHPTDELAVKLKGPGYRGKTEAWVILDANPETSRIYAGFRPGMTAEQFRTAMSDKTTPKTLHSFTPKPGECVFLEAGTVHAIGADIFLFEVQQTSDITYRLYDWDRVDAKTGQSRELHIEAGLIASNFATGPCEPVKPQLTTTGENLVNCRYFTLDRHTTATTIATHGQAKALVCTAGTGTIGDVEVQPGRVVLVPACWEQVAVEATTPLTILECGLGLS